MKVKDVLAVKGSNVIVINHEKTIFEAMSMFAMHRVGSLLIVDETKNIVGIIAARDVLMEVLRASEKIRETPVNSIMTRNIIVATPDDDLEYIQALMTENRIRHIPIMENKKLAGIVSIGDIVKVQLKEYHVENRYLREYIEGKYPA